MAENIDANLVLKVVVANFLEEVGALIGEFQAVEQCVGLEELAVVGVDAQTRVSPVHALEHAFEVLPAGILVSRELANRLPSLADDTARKELPVLAERDEHNAI